MWSRHLFFYTKKKKKKTKYKFTWLKCFIVIDWIKKYKLDRLNTTRLWILVTNYQRYIAFCPSYNLLKIKTKIKPRSTYSKTLNSEARLRNGKVLGTHSVQTKSSLLDSHDQCIPLCMIWMICCIHETLN